MGRMLNIGVQGGFVLEFHDAAERVSLAAGRDVCTSVGLQESGDHALKGKDVFLPSLFLSVGRSRLPLKGEYVEDSGGVGLCTGFFR